MSDFYVMKGPDLHGPLSSAQIRAGLQAQRFQGNDLLGESPEGPWAPITDRLAVILSDVFATDSALQSNVATNAPSGAGTHVAPERTAPPTGPATTRTATASPASPAQDAFHLLDCPGCGAKVSMTAPSCPRCGNPMGIQLKLTAFVRKASQHARKAIDDIVAETRKAIDEKDAIVVENTVVFGRSSEHADWVIPDPDVSATHARVVRVEGALQLHATKSRIGTLVNGEVVSTTDPHDLKDGDSIQIGSATFLVKGSTLVSTRRTDHAHLRGERLTRVVDAPDGSKQVILDDVTLNIPPKSFVVLLGPSGSGKSTLLGALNGRACATGGRVLLNQEDLYANYGRLRNRIANVPQKDNLHFELSLRKSLHYAAKLKLPRDTKAAERERLVAAAIDEVGMAKLCDAPMKHYSGGQVKRASVAHEILSRPSLICVDEATSGLDEHSDREIMGLLREIADRGKTILCITHNLANVQEFCDTLVVMANGGHLAFVGSPADALRYFAIESLSELYLALRKEPGEQWGRKWKAFVDTAAEKDASRAPDQRRVLTLKRDRVSPLQHVGMALLHGRVVLRRAIELALLDKVACYVMLLQPFLVFLVMFLLFGSLPEVDSLDNLQENLKSSLSIGFLLVVSVFWFGCSNSAKEVVKERGLYEKERHAGLNAIGYLGAKAAWLLSVTVAQSAFLLLFVKMFTGMEGSLFSYMPWIAAIASCGVAVGLCVSVFAPNSDVAVTTVPLVLIPQVVLGGLLKQVDGFAEFLSCLLVPCYWAYGGMANTICDALDVPTSGVALLRLMLAPESPNLALFVLAFSALGLFTLSGLTLNGVKVADVLNSDYVKAVKAKALSTLQGGASPTT